MADFEIDVARWIEKARGRVTEAFKATALDATAAVQALTPVDTGYLRANWTMMIDGEDEPVAGRTPPAADAAARVHLGQALVVVNPVVYARRINYGFVGEDSLGRHYDQPGYHMVEQVVNLLPTIAKVATARIAGGGQP